MARRSNRSCGDRSTSKNEPKFQAMGVNVGAGFERQRHRTGQRPLLRRVRRTLRVPGAGRVYLYSEDKEGQLDLGLVDRMGRFQAGVFSSFKYVSLEGNQSGGTLGQAAVTLDYVFTWGKVGIVRNLRVPE